jgi:hypothetical protein
VSETDIFLSYARHDRGTAKLFAECLGQEGFNVWWDAALRSGQTFDEVIERNLRDSKAVVVLWSPASVASRWVRAEATIADRRNKLAPAIIEACDRPIIFELTHTAELIGWAGDMSDPRWRTFASDLQRLIEAGADQARAAAVPAVGRADLAAAAADDDDAGPPPPGRRQSLRPGHDEVILADRMRRDSVPYRSVPIDPPAAEAAPPAEVHCLEAEDADVLDEPIIVDSSGLKIGRAPPADIILAHKSVSRQQCLLGLANDELFVTDLNSTNGTFIDDVRIDRAAILPVGSLLRIGQINLRHSVQLEPQAGHGNRAGDSRRPTGRLAATS